MARPEYLLPATFLGAILVGTALLMLPFAGHAQLNPEFGEMTNDIEAAITLMNTERKLVIMQEMQMTPEESQAFWPIYDEYVMKRKDVADMRVKLISDYAANFENITEDYADQMLDEYFDMAKKRMDLRKKYARQFKRVLPSSKVARYVQLENKLDAIIDFKLATSIPLIEPPAAEIKSASQ